MKKQEYSNIYVDEDGLNAITPIRVGVTEKAYLEDCLWVENVEPLFEGHKFYNISFLFTHSRCRVNKSLFKVKE